MPTLRIGTSHLVDRQVLGAFLDRVHQVDDTIALFDQIRAEKARISKKRPRSLVRRDVEPASFASLPQSIGLSRGHLEVSFATVEQLAESLYTIARLLEDEGDAFAQAFEPERPVAEPENIGEIRSMFAELEAMESAHAGKGPGYLERLAGNSG